MKVIIYLSLNRSTTEMGGRNEKKILDHPFQHPIRRGEFSWMEDIYRQGSDPGSL